MSLQIKLFPFILIFLFITIQNIYALEILNNGFLTQNEEWRNSLSLNKKEAMGGVIDYQLNYENLIQYNDLKAGIWNKKITYSYIQPDLSQNWKIELNQSDLNIENQENPSFSINLKEPILKPSYNLKKEDYEIHLSANFWPDKHLTLFQQIDYQVSLFPSESWFRVGYGSSHKIFSLGLDQIEGVSFVPIEKEFQFIRTGYFITIMPSQNFSVSYFQNQIEGRNLDENRVSENLLLDLPGKETEMKLSWQMVPLKTHVELSYDELNLLGVADAYSDGTKRGSLNPTIYQNTTQLKVTPQFDLPLSLIFRQRKLNVSGNIEGLNDEVTLDNMFALGSKYTLDSNLTIYDLALQMNPWDDLTIFSQISKLNLNATIKNFENFKLIPIPNQKDEKRYSIQLYYLTLGLNKLIWKIDQVNIFVSAQQIIPIYYELVYAEQAEDKNNLNTSQYQTYSNTNEGKSNTVPFGGTFISIYGTVKIL